MAKTKTTYTGASVTDFIREFADSEQKKADSFRLIELMREWSGWEPKMWGPTIIGFGNYHYKYASGHEGDAPVLGFSPRKSAISLYVYSPTEKSDAILPNLGPFKMGKACIYIKKLDDISLAVLKELCLECITYTCAKYDCTA